ncbi:hypothetical protein NQ317_012988 [Molorchus minor]|uniref:Uncharacterized protein n=1 Tax=Molorchus minor TaxID=1323400 RepID=A0ABQ9JDL4_9CUCU|nr:hypothetical protein NQ317_012988 [Molorchus minor]
MSEGTYEYECMRAELLGMEKPDHDEFLENKLKEKEIKGVEEEELDTENLKAADQQREILGKMTGGMEELNNILKKTQFRINRLRNPKTALVENTTGENSSGVEKTAPNEVKPRKSDLAKALDADSSKIDSMIEKAEKAQFSMEQQRKQINKFLK